MRLWAGATTAMFAVLGVVACADGDESSSAETTAVSRPSDVRSSGGYRIVGTPLVGVSSGRTPQGEPFVDATVLVRLNRRLKTDGDLVTARILLNGASGTSPPVGVGRRARHCYLQTPDLPPDSSIRTGDTGTLVVQIPGVKPALRTRVLFRNERERTRLYEKFACGEGTYNGPD